MIDFPELQASCVLFRGMVKANQASFPHLPSRKCSRTSRTEYWINGADDAKSCRFTSRQRFLLSDGGRRTGELFA